MEIKYRSVQTNDAEALIEHIRSVGRETDFLSFDGDTFNISIEREQRFITRFLSSGYDYMIVALDGEKIVGNAAFEGERTKRYSHRCNLSISVLREYWGIGIGSVLMEMLIAEAKFRGFEIISLEVRADNDRAIELYRRFGFEIIGTYRSFFKINNEYFDAYYMNLYLKK